MLKALDIAGGQRIALSPHGRTFEEQGFAEFMDFANHMLLVSGAMLRAPTRQRIQTLARQIASSRPSRRA